MKSFRGKGVSAFKETVVLRHGLYNSQREERDSYRDFQIVLVREEGNWTSPSLLKETGDSQIG